MKKKKINLMHSNGGNRDYVYFVFNENEIEIDRCFFMYCYSHGSYTHVCFSCRFNVSTYTQANHCRVADIEKKQQQQQLIQ